MCLFNLCVLYVYCSFVVLFFATHYLSLSLYIYIYVCIYIYTYTYIHYINTLYVYIYIYIHIHKCFFYPHPASVETRARWGALRNVYTLPESICMFIPYLVRIPNNYSPSGLFSEPSETRHVRTDERRNETATERRGLLTFIAADILATGMLASLVPCFVACLFLNKALLPALLLALSPSPMPNLGYSLYYYFQTFVFVFV